MLNIIYFRHYLGMLTGEQFRERLATWDKPQPMTFLFQDVLGIVTADFPPDAKIIVLRYVDFSPSPGARAIKVEFDVTWMVRDGRFAIDLVEVAADSPWNSSRTPAAYCDLMHHAIENRQVKAQDVRLDKCVLAPRQGIAFACGYTLTPPEPELSFAYFHALKARMETLGTAYGAANRLDDHFKAEVARIDSRESWLPGHVQVASISGKLHQIVKQPGTSDSRAIFIMAELFRDAAFILYRRACACKVDDLMLFQLMVPVLVNTAFAVELLFKCLVCIETGKPAWGHDLKHLYKALTQDSQDKVREYYDSFAANNPKNAAMESRHGTAVAIDLNSVLTANRKTFEDWRYLYQKHPTSGFGLGDVQRAVRKRIFDLEPDWSVLVSSEPVLFNPHAEFVQRKKDPLDNR